MKLADLMPIHIDEYASLGGSYGYVSSKKDVHPFTYLDFAKEDMEEEGSRRALINAVGNAKRAFHFQVDLISKSFGWEQLNGKRNSNFSEKLDFLAQCGVVSPNILRKLNRVRNKVEHDYVVPTQDEVEDYIDVVELFLLATKTVTETFPEEIELELMEDEYYDSSLNLPKNIHVRLALETGGIVFATSDEERRLAIKDPEYFEWLAPIIRNTLRA